MTTQVPSPPVINGLTMVRRFGPGDPRFAVTALPVLLRRAFGDAALADVCEFECGHGKRVISPVVFVQRGIVRCRAIETAATAADGSTRHRDFGAAQRWNVPGEQGPRAEQLRREADRDACALQLVWEWTEAYEDG